MKVIENTIETKEIRETRVVGKVTITLTPDELLAIVHDMGKSPDGGMAGYRLYKALAELVERSGLETEEE